MNHSGGNLDEAKGFKMKTLLLIFFTAGISSTIFAQYPNVRVNSPSANSPEEVSIAINPLNPLQLAAGSNLNYAYRSNDGGQSWVQSVLTSSYSVWGDPALTFDASGNLYYVHLTNPGSPGYFIDRIVVQKSIDGGATYSNGTAFGYNPPRKQQDKAWPAADMTNSPYRNNLYVAWTEFDSYGSGNAQDSSRILFTRSTDGGLTWSPSIRISDKAGNCVDSDSTDEGAVPAVGPNGEVYVSWSGPLGIVFDKSTNGGITFGADRFVTSQPGGWDFNVPGIYRANGLPITACDVSNSPYRGTIYINWSDQRNGLTNTDVFLIKSTDGGSTWSSVRKVNDDLTTTHQFFTWMTIDQATGALYFVFYDRRNSTGTATDVFVAKSTDGGETFQNFKVSQSSFSPQAGTFFGDYTGIAAFNKKIYPIWTRLDGSSLSVWTALVTDTTSTLAVTEIPNQFSDYQLLQNYPNPFNPTTNIDFYVGREGMVRVEVFDITGRKVTTLVNEYQSKGWHSAHWNVEDSQATGVFICQLEAGGFIGRRKLMLMK